MQVKRYRAADSQQAMRLVRAAHGPDAVILDCHTVEGGVEVLVSLDEGAEATSSSAPSFAEQARSPQQLAQQISRQFGTASAKGKEKTALDALLERQQKAKEVSGQTQVLSAQSLSRPKPQNERQNTSGGSTQAPHIAWSQQDELFTLKQDLASMKSMLMGQLKGHNWQQASFHAPEQSGLNDFLAALDIDPALGKRLASEIPAEESDGLQREMLQMLLSKQLPVMTPPRSGAICLVGPQGAGKTTTIAKIAAQYVLTHGRDGIAILTTDVARVGAQEQLRAYGRILQIPVHSAGDLEEAVKTYRILRKKTLVLIDTAGISFRDTQGINELQRLTSAMQDVQVFLTLPADAEAYVQSVIIDAYAGLSPRGAVVTRIDEAMRLGGILSNLIQHRLPVAWCANGPKVPQNLSSADAAKLVNMATRMARAFEHKRGKETSLASKNAERGLDSTMSNSTIAVGQTSQPLPQARSSLSLRG
jgi:flagellar biosynthesis protein FlhF